jgi:mannose-6-phosphate isomerase-like protein (cupin superfamily)
MHADQLAGDTIGRRDGSFVLAEWRIAAPAEGEKPMPMAPLHLHHHDDEAWYVVKGRLSVRLGDETATVDAGGAILAPAGTPHTFWNAGPEECRYVIVMTPRIIALIDAIHEVPGEERATRIPEVFREFDSELL